MKTDNWFNRIFYKALPPKQRAKIAATTFNDRLIYLSVIDKNNLVWDAFKIRHGYELSQQVEFCVLRKKIYHETLIKLLTARVCNEKLFQEILYIIRRDKIVLPNILEQLTDKILNLAYNPTGLLTVGGSKNKTFWFCEEILNLHKDNEYPAWFTLPVIEKFYNALCYASKQEETLNNRVKYMLANLLLNPKISDELQNKIWKKLYTETNFQSMQSTFTDSFIRAMSSERNWSELPSIARVDLFYNHQITQEHIESWAKSHPNLWKKDLNSFLIEKDFIVDTTNIPLQWLEEIARTVYEDTNASR